MRAVPTDYEKQLAGLVAEAAAHTQADRAELTVFSTQAGASRRSSLSLMARTSGDRLVPERGARMQVQPPLTRGFVPFESESVSRERFDDTTLAEMRRVALVANDSGFNRVEIDPQQLAEIVAELLELRARARQP